MRSAWSPFVAAVGSVVVLANLGCAAAPPPSKPAVVFPPRAEVAAIPAARPNLQAFGEIDISNEPWTVQVEPTTPETPYDDATPWGDFIREAVKPHAQSVSLSSPMKCASTEIARWNRQSKQLLPPMNLIDFIVARCGAMVSSARPIVWRVDAPETVTDDVILDAAKKRLTPELDKLFATSAKEHLVVGLGIVRDDKGASVAITAANDDAILDPGPLRADANHLVSIRGTARGDFASITALVNQGPLGVAHCAPQGDLPPPHFAFTCKLADGDPYAWVELMGQRKGLVLSREIAAGIVTAADTTEIVYKSKSDSPPAPVGTPAELSNAIVAGVNRARAAARLPPVTLSAPQSAENARLVGTLVNAAIGDMSGSSDKAAIGLLAGWDVTGGMIRNATIFVAAIAPTHDATTWLDWALERPAGRLTLLDPSSRAIAVGSAVPPEGSGLGAAVTTYAFFESDNHAREEAAVYDRITAARAARGLPAPVRLAGFPEMHEQALHVLKDNENALTALQTMLDVASSKSGASTRGYVVETTDVDHFQLPDVAMQPGNLRLAVAVTHHRAEGAAWGQYVIFLVGVGDYVPQGMEAKAERGRSPR